MTISQEQFERIRRWRTVYLPTPDGRRCLLEHLKSTGLFEEPDAIRATLENDPSRLSALLLGFDLLYDMGVWTYDNFARLIDKMGELPIPDIEELDNGST